MGHAGHRLNVTLDQEHAARLRGIAERTHVQEAMLASSLLSLAIEKIDRDARRVTAILDSIPGACESARLGLEQGRAGETSSG
jgi:hypothetical protein